MLNPLLVEKSRIAEKGDYNLSGERYRDNLVHKHKNWDMVELGEVCEFQKGTSITKANVIEGNIPVIAGGKQPAYYHNQSNRNGNIITVSSSGANAGFVNYFEYPIFASDCITIQSKSKSLLSIKYLFFLLKNKQDDIYKLQKGGGQPHVYSDDLDYYKIPLPPLSVQQEIVSEIENYQKIIDGAKQVIQNYKPQIKIEDDWEMVELGEVITLEYGVGLKEADRREGEFPVYGSNGIIGYHNEYLVEAPFIIIGRKGTAGAITYSEQNGFPIDTTFFVKIKDTDKVRLKYLYFILPFLDLQNLNTQSGVPGLNRNDAYLKLIPLPPLSIQQEIVSRIEEEQKLVDANKRLIEIFEQKIKDKINEVWEG
ncbi:MAG: restriction endonuclease subunit S [Candidatus Coatesbacteria bacterium]|nr:restriction endonuclease subunit S [Candidatus Coatesbacteria bacterium]